MENKTVPFSPQSVVVDLLDQWPQVVSVFIKHGMACVGCHMSAFETIEDATRNYAVSTADFIVDLENAINL